MALVNKNQPNNMNPSRPEKAELIIVDDNLIFRQVLKTIISMEEIATVTGEASNGLEFLEILLQLKPDLVLMDIEMPLMSGIEATQKALELMPDLKIIAITQYENEEYCEKMFALGARGFVLKSNGIRDLEKAIESVIKGKNYLYKNNRSKQVKKQVLL